jgi:hypothetical protein
LAIIAAAFAYLWLNYDGLLHAVSFDERPGAAPVVDSGDEPVTQKDFESFKRQMTESLQATIENLDAQKADLKKLSDQVSALTAKIDALQTAATPATQPVAPARPPVVAARKKPLGPKTPGPISVWGAPLPPPPSDGQ